MDNVKFKVSMEHVQDHHIATLLYEHIIGCHWPVIPVVTFLTLLYNTLKSYIAIL